MITYLITSLPVLSFDHRPTITEKQFINLVYQCIDKQYLHDFNLLVNFHKHLQLDAFDSLSHKRKTMRNLRNNLINIKLKYFITQLINLEEVTVGLLCKKKNISIAHLNEFFSEHIDSTSKFLINKYNHKDMGIGKRFFWFHQLDTVWKTGNAIAIENVLDKIKLALLDDIKPDVLFTVDTLLIYYIELNILLRRFSFNRQLGYQMLENILNNITL